VAGLEGNIAKAEASACAEGKARIRLDLRIKDIRHLEAIVKRIAGLKEVRSVERG
jgi:(p)ppGpp synthase/HD superfamily hydrolase